MCGRARPWQAFALSRAGARLCGQRDRAHARWDWLDDDQGARIAGAVPHTLSANAWRSDLGATWHAVVDRSRPPWLCRH